MRAIFWTLVAFLACAAAANDKKIVCYFGSWAVYRPGNGMITIPEINPQLCTHLVYTFVGISTNGKVSILDPWADLPSGKDGFNQFNQLRAQNPRLKTLIAIGGWNEGSYKYSKVVADPELRKTFVENAVTFVRKYNFNGLDFDWEYPNQRGGTPADKENFVLLLRELRSRFDEEGLLLTAALGATELSASKSYIIPEISKYLHFMNIMAYDFHGEWDKKTGIHAPLYPGSWEKGNEKLLNIKAVIDYWISQGAPRDKIVLGMPTYGRSFTLDNPEKTGIGAPAGFPGAAGPYTRSAGTLGYNEICESQLNGNWKVYFDEEQRVPYTVSGDQWVGYDDPRSIKEKAEFVKKLDLGGAMIWSIETDDFKGICGNKYPILRTLNDVLRAGAAPIQD